MTREHYRRERRKARALAAELSEVRAARPQISEQIMAVAAAFNATITDTPEQIDQREFEKYDRGDWHNAAARDRHIARMMERSPR